MLLWRAFWFSSYKQRQVWKLKFKTTFTRYSSASLKWSYFYWLEMTLVPKLANRIASFHFLKAGLHLRALRSLFFEQSFHAIGQKKNEAILLARSDVMSARLEKKLKYIQLFSKRAHDSNKNHRNSKTNFF